MLNGSASTNPSGIGTLTYNWAFKSRPAGSAAVLSNATSVMPSFVVDVGGPYIVTLTVSNGAGSDTANVTISTVNSPPVAKAGPNQTVAVGSTVMLNGSGSSDVDGDPLTYLWTFVARPTGSSAVVFGFRSVTANFVPDIAGTYVVQLVVNDGKLDSTPATVTITTATSNTAPVANAGPNQAVSVGALVQLNGSTSTDVDGDTLTYKWSLNSIPQGSAAVLSSTTAFNPTFTADKPGTYVAQLIVNDGKVDSAPATVTITTNAVQAPTANAGPNQTVVHGATVTLNGSATDAQSLPLTLAWSFIARPTGSTAVLSSTTVAKPTFVADLPGNYVVQLVASNGILSSAPSTVTITTTNTPPVAVAGTNQNVSVGMTVPLDGGASTDADHDPLTYSWSFASRPAGSNAVLSAATSSSPTFVADVAGSYVVQLIVNDGFTNSSPSTVTVTASAMKITLTPNPLNLLGSPGTLTVSLGAPAGAGGQDVTLSGFDPAVISLPSSVHIDENATGANVTVTPVAPGSTFVLATAPGFQPGSTSVTVTTASLSISLDAPGVGVTRTMNGTITLSAPAAPGDVTVQLSANPDGIVTLDPTTVTIAAGSTTGHFTVTGVAEGSATITATASNHDTATANVLVVKLGGIAIQSDVIVAPGKSAPLGVTLTTPAPTNGVTVTLTSGNQSILTVSTSVFIPQGATQPTTPAQITGVAFGTTTVTASAGGYTGSTQTVKVGLTLSFSPQTVSVGAGTTKSIQLLLSAPAPAGGLSVTLNSSNDAIFTVPPSASFAEGAASADVLVTGVAPGTATLTATTNVPTVSGATASVGVVKYGVIMLPTNPTVGLGQSVDFPVSLSTDAVQGGVTITLSTSDGSTVDISPKTLTIAAGQKLPAVQPKITGVALGSATITAVADGFGSASQAVQSVASLSFSSQTVNLNGAETKTLTLTLSSAAPAGGLLVTLTAAPTGIVTMPSSVTIPANSPSTTVSITGNSAGTTTITAAAASASNVTAATVTATVQSSGSIDLPQNVTLTPGQTVAFPVTLKTAAVGAVQIQLSSSDSGKVSISPATVTIEAGQTQPATQPQVTGVDFGSASISANAPGYASGSELVKVGGSLSFAPQSVTITGPETKNLTLTLSTTAPSDVQVNLTASPAGIVTIPALVTINKGATTATVAVAGAGAGTATITAAAVPANISSATATATVQTAGAISLPANVTIPLGQSVPLQVSLPAPAPKDVTVTLASDSSRVTVSPTTIVIPAGQQQPATAPQLSGKDLGTATITASAPAYTSATQSVQVTGTIALSPQSLSLNGTETKNLTLTLSGPAPTGGLTFQVSSTNTGVATVGSATATIAANATTTQIAVTGVAGGSATIRVSAPNLTDATASVTVSQPVDIIIPPTVTVSPGDSVPFSIALAKAATTTVFLEISTSDATKATPTLTSVAVQPGQTVPSQTIRIQGVAAGTATITVKSTNTSLFQATSTVTVQYTFTAAPSTLTLAANGNQANVTITLSGPAPPAGIHFNLTSSNTQVATVSSSVPMSGGSTTVTTRVTSVGQGSAVIHITSPDISAPEATVNVTVTQAGSFTIGAPATMGLTTEQPLAVTLSSAAPSGGVTVTLTSSDTAKVSISPASVLIPAGQTTPTTQPTITAVNVGDVTITASATGGFTAPAPSTVKVNATITWITQNVTIVGVNKQANVVLRLNATAPQGLAGVVVNLTSTAPSVATIQATGIFLWDGSTAPSISIPVTSVGPGTTTIKASGTNVPEVTMTVTVTGDLTDHNGISAHRLFGSAL